MSELRDANVRVLRQVYAGLEERSEQLVDDLELGFRVPPHEVLVHDASLVVAPAGTAFGSEVEHGVDIYHFEAGLISEVWITPWGRPETAP